MSFYHNWRWNKSDLIALLTLFGLVLLFNWRFLFGREIFAFRDLTRYFYPLRFIMAQQVKSGILPLWDPNIFCGFPLLATLQIGFFYPLTVIHYLLPFGLAFNWYMIIHYFLAAAFTYAMLRYFRLPAAAAFFGGFVFAFSGYLLSVSNMNSSLSAVIWLPLVLIFFDRLILGARPLLDFILLSILLALMLLGGEPTIIYTTGWLLVGYALVFAPRRLFSLLLLAGAFLTAFALIAVQLVPFLELARLSDRVVRTKYEFVSVQSFPPREILTFLFPYFFGNMSGPGSYNAALLGNVSQLWLVSPYMGILPLIMIFFAFSRKKLAWFFAGGAALSLLFAVGGYTPFYRLAYAVMPAISMIRYPIKYLFLTTFCLAVLSAFGLAALIDDAGGERAKFRRLARWLAPFALLALGLAFSAIRYAQAIFDLLAKYYPRNYPVEIMGKLAEIVTFNILSLLNLAIYLLLLLVAAWLVQRGRLSGRYFAAIVILLTVAELYANGASIPVGISAKIFTEVPPNYALLDKNTNSYRFDYSYRLGKENCFTYGEDYDAAMRETKDNFSDNWHILYGLQNFSGYESIQPQAWRSLMFEKFTGDNFIKRLDFLSRANVRYIAGVEKWRKPGLKLLRHKRNYGLDVYLYENLNYYPRAYLLGDRRAAVKMDKYSPLEVIVTATARRPDKLFLADSYYPGWKAFVDGKEAPIEKSLILFRAVKIPAGTHTVRFVYDPLSLKIGAGISLLTLVGLLAGLYLERRKWNIEHRT
jgi:hypothetical protein